MNKGLTALDRQRKEAIGTGLANEEPIHLEALDQCPRTGKAKAYWLFCTFTMYARYHEIDKALNYAEELRRQPSKSRHPYDCLVANKLVNELAAYNAAIDYIDASLTRTTDLATLIRHRNDNDELCVLRTVAKIAESQLGSDDHQKQIETLVAYYAFTPKLQPFLDVLRQYELIVIQSPQAILSLNHVEAMLRQAVHLGDENRKTDLKAVRDASRRALKQGKS